MSERRSFPRFGKSLAVQYVVNGTPRTGITTDVSATGLYIVGEEAPAAGEKLVVDVTTRVGDVLQLRGRVADTRGRTNGSTGSATAGFALALDAYNEAYERLVLALSADPPSAASRRPKKLELGAEAGAKASPEPPLMDVGLVRILLVDSAERTDLLLREAVSKIEVGSFQVEWLAGAREGLAALEQRRHEIAFVSWRLAPSGGLTFLRSAIAAGCETPIVVLTNVHDRNLELQAIREGAADALDVAHLDADSLERAIRYTLERVRLAAARRAAERELQDFYDRAPCGYQMLDENGVIIRINETALSWLGYAREEVVGVRRFTDLLEPGCVPRYQEQVRWFLEPGRLRDLQLELRRKDGTLLPVSASASFVSAAGGASRSRWTLLDATERREPEAALRRLVKAIETMQTGVTIADLFGTILYVNPAAAAMHGYEVEELIGTDARLLMPEELRRETWREWHGPVLRWKRDGKGLRKDGSVFAVHLVSDLLADELGAAFAIVTCYEDRSGGDERLARVTRAAGERLVEELGAAETTIRSLSALLLDRLGGDEEA
jgi:PAS domain S-box-containing protein